MPLISKKELSVCVCVVVQNPDRNVIQEIATQHKSLKTFQPPIT